MKTFKFFREQDCWDGYKKDGKQDGTGKNKGKMVNKCVKEDDFEPHMMYDPKTGKSKMAKVKADHLKMKDMGWSHEAPK